MAVDPINAVSSNTATVDPSRTGFAALTSESFLKLLITELQNQDPTEPIGNEELLNQISMMRNLQSNIELSSALESLTTNQQLSTAASFIGKTVTGINGQQQQVVGMADRAFLADGKAFIGIGSEEIPLSGVTEVQLAGGN